MSQLSYNQYQDAALAGMKADIGNDDVMSLKAEEALLDGHLCVIGTSELQGKLPAAAADITNIQKFGGVVVRSLAREMNAAGAANYGIGEMAPAMKKGRIWVVVETAIVVGTSTVNVRYAGVGQKGAFRADAVSSETAVLPNARWVKGTAGAGLALLELI